MYLSQIEAVATAKQFRKDADALLQRMKEHLTFLTGRKSGFETSELLMAALEKGKQWNSATDTGEVIAQHTLSIRELESCIMRQGMALKYIGTPDPYPQSRNPESPVVEPTTDGLKL